MTAVSPPSNSVALRRAQAFFQAIPHGRDLGLEVIAFENNTVTSHLPFRPELVGNPWTRAIHGGVITTMIDQTSGVAVFCVLDTPEMVATLDLRIDYMRSAEPDRPLYARAECYRLTPSIAFVRCEAYQDDASRPVATSVSSFMRTPGTTSVLVQE